MAAVSYHMIDKYIIEAVCTAPLHIGSAVGDKSEVLVHPVSNLPFIQATSISGVLRSTSLQMNGKEITERLFGASRLAEGSNAGDYASRVRIEDGIFDPESLKMELRPRLALNPVTGSVNSSKQKGSDRMAGQKFEMESIGTGALFSVNIYLYDAQLREALENVFAELKAEHLQIGGQKSNGAGYIGLKELKHISFDLTRKEDRKNWAKEDTLPDKAYENMTGKLNPSKAGITAYEIILTGKTESSLLVKGIALKEFGKDAPDAANIRNASEEYIVPGSSLKGSIKSQTGKIAKVLGKEFLIDRIFGMAGSQEKKGNSGCIHVRDTVIGSIYDNDLAPTKHRIHIDKFTGGVIERGLFSEKDAFGSLRMEIRIDDKKDADAAAGLILLAFRDLAAGLMNVGSGYNAGKGFIDADSIEIRDVRSNCSAKIHIKKGSILDENHLIEKCLSALKNAKEVC